MSRGQGVLGAARAPEAFLSPMRIFSLLLPAGSLCFAILLGLPGAIYAPDALHYRLLALGQRNEMCIRDRVEVKRAGQTIDTQLVIPNPHGGEDLSLIHI